MKETICKLPVEYADQPKATVTLDMPAKLLEKVKKQQFWKRQTIRLLLTVLCIRLLVTVRPRSSV